RLRRMWPSPAIPGEYNAIRSWRGGSCCSDVSRGQSSRVRTCSRVLIVTLRLCRCREHLSTCAGRAARDQEDRRPGRGPDQRLRDQQVATHIADAMVSCEYNAMRLGEAIPCLVISSSVGSSPLPGLGGRPVHGPLMANSPFPNHLLTTKAPLLRRCRER